MTYPFDHISWTSRTKKIARIIPPGSSVIDLGAGKENLRKFLRSPRRYIPIDKFPLSPETIVADFNRNEFPEIFPPADYVVAQGIIEYLEDPENFLRAIREYAPRLIVSYREEVGSPGMDRMNDFSFGRLVEIFRAAGWEIVRQIEFTPKHAIFECKKV